MEAVFTLMGEEGGGQMQAYFDRMRVCIYCAFSERSYNHSNKNHRSLVALPCPQPIQACRHTEATGFTVIEVMSGLSLAFPSYGSIVGVIYCSRKCDSCSTRTFIE